MSNAATIDTEQAQDFGTEESRTIAAELVRRKKMDKSGKASYYTLKETVQRLAQRLERG